MREFDSGATRDTDENKLDFEGFLSPLVLNRYAEYMNKNRVQADGKLRDSDNWQKGIPKTEYMKSGFRHFFDWWFNHRGLAALARETIEEALCGLLFNAMGYLHEHLKKAETPAGTFKDRLDKAEPGECVRATTEDLKKGYGGKPEPTDIEHSHHYFSRTGTHPSSCPDKVEPADQKIGKVLCKYKTADRVMIRLRCGTSKQVQNKCKAANYTGFYDRMYDVSSRLHIIALGFPGTVNLYEDEFTIIK